MSGRTLAWALALGVGFASVAIAQPSRERRADQAAPTAASRFAEIRKTARAAREGHDANGYLAAIQDLAKLVNYSGSSMLNLAIAYAGAGNTEQAIKAFRDFVAMGQFDAGLAGRAQFEGLKTNPDFQAIQKLMEQNQVPIQRAAPVVDFPDAGLVPEDIDYDARSKSFLVTSVLERKIVRLAVNGTQKNFAASPSGWPMLALRIDTKRGLVWATEVALDKFAIVPEKDWGRSALVCFKLADASLERRIEGPAHSALGDMALTANGDVIVSDGEGGGVYRMRAAAPKDASLERLDAGDFISPQTPAVLPDGRHVFVPDYVRGVGVLDLETKQVRWIDGNRQHALQGIDGLYYRAGFLFATQNGAAPERVVQFRLDDRLSRIVAEEVIERATPGLGDPTHGVIVGDEFFYIANSGWDALDDNGKLKPDARMTPARIMKAPLKAR